MKIVLGYSGGLDTSVRLSWIIVNNELEAVQLSEGPNAVTANTFSNVIAMISTCALNNAETTFKGADGMANCNYLDTFVGNWVYGEQNGVLSAYDPGVSSLTPNLLNFSGNYLAFPGVDAYTYPSTTPPAGIAANTEFCTTANICGNTLASGAYGLYYNEACTNALLLNNDFRGATFGALGDAGGTNFIGMATAQIISNKLAAGVTFHVQVPQQPTNASAWFLYENQFFNTSSNAVLPFLDPVSSPVHIVNY